MAAETLFAKSIHERRPLREQTLRLPVFVSADPRTERRFLDVSAGSRGRIEKYKA